MRLRVVELFAGVGGFRLGLEAAGHEIVWWNQWEPSTRLQFAYDCYRRRFHPTESVIDPVHNTDISKVPPSGIPPHDLLVGGFPCQDYSVAAPLRHSRGLRGKKGALWWEITKIIARKKPSYVLLENVDRLLRSPRTRRGRDFAVVLASLSTLGYAVEWRIINAADYGEPQKRRRVFIFAARNGTAAARQLKLAAREPDVLTRSGFFAKEFPVVQEPLPRRRHGPRPFRIRGALHIVSRTRNFPTFENAGIMVARRVWTRRVMALRETPAPNLSSAVIRGAPDRYYVPESLWPKWEAAKAAKDLIKKARGGYSYRYNEGKIPFPDPLTQPARTLLTTEGRIGPSRSNHIIEDPWTKRLRILMPEECENLMGFQPGHTEGMPPRWRYFVLGNAVVVGLVNRIGKRITSFIEEHQEQRGMISEEPVPDARRV